MEKVAALLPVYAKDNAVWFKLSLESVLNQSQCEPTVYIGVDGQVGANIQEVLSMYENNKRVKVFLFPENRGLAMVLNDLLHAAMNDGFEYLARMDADDISVPDRMEKQIAYLVSHPNIDVVGGSIEEIDEYGNLTGKCIVYPQTPENCYKFFSRRNPHAHPAVLFRKSFFDKLKGAYRPEYRQNQDTMLWYDGMMVGTKHANISNVVLRFRITNSFFKKRRNGWSFAKKQLHDRKIINQHLGYGISATLFAYMMFCLLVCPVWVKKIAYKIFR